MLLKINTKLYDCYEPNDEIFYKHLDNWTLDENKNTFDFKFINSYYKYLDIKYKSPIRFYLIAG